MSIPSEYEWFKKVNDIYIGNQNFYNFTTVVNQDWGQSYLISPYDYTWTGIVYQGTDYKLDYAHENANAVWLSCYSPIIRVDITTIGVDYPRVTYSNANLTRPFSDGQYTYKFTTQNSNMTYQNYPSYQLFPPASFETLDDALEYLYSWFTNITLYVDGELWIQAGPIQYTWQSVPSISGKNGILSLVTLDSEAINDGEPVSGAAVSVFDQAPSTDNDVKDLADTYGSGEESSAVDVTVKYKVTLPPGGAFSVLKLVAKKDSIPEDATDGDKIVDISPTKTKKTVTGLDENSMYYFKIFAEDSNSNTSESDEKHILTSGDEGYNFDYTGEIVEWTVPKTGIYSLETWGAQGGNATDGTNSARGGYGAYAYGEVLLTQGEKLYINVGGQNGYGGGGGFNPYRQVNSWEASDGNTYDCLKINDYSIIPQSIKDSTTMTYSKLTNGGSLPSYIEEQGDLIHTSVYSDIANNIQINYCDNEKLKIILGKYYSTETSSRPFYGVGFYDVRVSTSSSFCGEGWIDYGSTAIASYIGVVLDISEHRGYIIWDAYLTNHPSRNGHNIYVVGGKSNGVDIIWETFKNG